MKPFKLIILASFLFTIVAVTGFAQGNSPKSQKQKVEKKAVPVKEKAKADESAASPSSTGLRRLTNLSDEEGEVDQEDIDILINIDIDEDALQATIERSVEGALESIEPILENLAIEPFEVEIDMEDLDIDIDNDIDIDDDNDIDVDIDVDYDDWEDDGDDELWNDQDEKDKAKNKDKAKSDKEKDRSKGLKKIKGN